MSAPPTCHPGKIAVIPGPPGMFPAPVSPETIDLHKALMESSFKTIVANEKKLYLIVLLQEHNK